MNNPRIAAFVATDNFTDQEAAWEGLADEDRIVMRDAVIAWVREKEDQGAFDHTKSTDACKGCRVDKVGVDTYIVKEFMHGAFRHMASIRLHNSHRYHYCLFYKYLFRPE